MNNEVENLYEGNVFIDLAELAYDATYFPKDDDYKIIEKKRGLFRKPEQVSTNIKKDEINSHINKMIKDMEDANALPFNTLWLYCQFIRFAEKVLFRNNNPKNSLYVDSDMKDYEERRFQLSGDNFTAIFILSRKNIDGKTSKIIDLTIKRTFGKEMVNQFIIVDSEVKYNDDSDIYLMNTINQILKNEVATSFYHIINNIFSKVYF